MTSISEPNLSALENDRMELSKKYAESLGAALGVHPMDILYPEGIFIKNDYLKEIEEKAKVLIGMKKVY